MRQTDIMGSLQMPGKPWGDWFMELAQTAATKSKDTTQVGAILVGEDRDVRLVSYNGPPRGIKDTPDRFERPNKYLFASHAEQNLIAFAAREGIRTRGATVVCTHYPCSSCARTLIQAGIKNVMVGPGSTSMPEQEFEAARTMFAEAGVGVFKKE
jgi:dCMP deaminase